MASWTSGIHAPTREQLVDQLRSSDGNLGHNPQAPPVAAVVLDSFRWYSLFSSFPPSTSSLMSRYVCVTSSGVRFRPFRPLLTGPGADRGRWCRGGAEGGGGGEGVGCCKEGRLWSRSGSRGGGGEGRSARSVVDGVGCWSRSRITGAGSSCWCWSGSHWRCGIWWSHRNFSSTVCCMWVAGSTSTVRERFRQAQTSKRRRMCKGEVGLFRGQASPYP